MTAGVWPFALPLPWPGSAAAGTTIAALSAAAIRITFMLCKSLQDRLTQTPCNTYAPRW